MTTAKASRALLAAALLAVTPTAWSAFDPVNDDTDIFLANPAFSSTRPNVLIFVDNSANWGQNTRLPSPWSSKYEGVVQGLLQVINSGVVTANFNVGLALFGEVGSPNNSVDGAYIRFGIRQMTAANKSQLATVLTSLDKTGDDTNNAVYSLAMNEIYNYFAGIASYSGHSKEKVDAGGTIYFPSGRVALAGSPLAAGALPEDGSSGSAQTYVSPIADGCQKNFIIFISNGTANDNSASLSTAQAFLAGITGTNPPPTISISPSGSQGIWADEYAKFMANGDCNLSIAGVQNVYTYTIDIIPGAELPDRAHTALLQSMAVNGKGKYFAITNTANTNQLQDALNSIFTEVQAVNSVFASTTLPVSVNVRGTNLNQVYIGVFRPDPQKSPRWFGNLKLYKLGVNPATDTLFLADATGAAAENAATGFISANATSYWTTSQNYWGFLPQGVGGSNDMPDGDLVEKGGAAQRLRLAFPGPTSTDPDHTSRNLYTCLDTTASGPCATIGLSSTLFNTSNVVPGDIGAYTTKPVISLTSSGTTATATVTAHGWSGVGNVVRVTGATPTNYNVEKEITIVDENTFSYTMDVAPDPTRARITAANHQLLNGDLTCVSAAPSGFNNCWTPLTRIDANKFDYTPSAPQASAASQIYIVYGGRKPQSVVGIPGQSAVKVVLPNHGYGAAGATIPNSYLLLINWPGSLPWWYACCGITSTVLDDNTLSIAAQSSPITGTPNAAQVTAPNHGFSTGQSITISGAPVTAYNGSNQSVTRVDVNTFLVPSTETLADASASIRAGHVISSITHPTIGAAAGRDTGTVTTATAHGFTVNQTVNIFGSGANFAIVGACLGYDGAWVIQATPTTTTFEIFHSNIDACPESVSTAGMIAGYAVTRIDPALTETGTNIVHWKTINATAINPLTTATGTILAGRPIDGDTTERDNLVNWIRSQDNKNNEDRNAVATDVRASAHADVLHSRPATINYNRLATLITGSTEDDVLRRDSDVYVFYGSNDGIMHAVKGGILQKTDGTPPLTVTVGPDANVTPGSERWGFMPQEFFGTLKRLRDETPAITNATPKDYFFDGSIGVYQRDVVGSGNVSSPATCDPSTCSSPNDVTGVIGDNTHSTLGDKVLLVFSLRRGGDFIYVLDVTNPTAPKLQWRKGFGNAGWEQVGQTWSEPKIAKSAASLGNSNNPENVIVVMGAGYDKKVEDINPCLLRTATTTAVEQKAIGSGSITYTAAGACTISNPTGSPTPVPRERGRGILVVDAFNGNVVWQAGAGVTTSNTAGAKKLEVPDMTCAIPSDVTVLIPNKQTSIATKLYFGDTCGQVWRVDMANPDMDEWTVTKIASIANMSSSVTVGGDTFLTGVRKFLFPPDLVSGTDTGTPSTYTAVLLGSGDREHPFDTNVVNRFYMFKDRASLTSLGPTNSTSKKISGFDPTPTGDPIGDSDVFDATNQVVTADTSDPAFPKSLKGWKVTLVGGEKVVGSAITVAGTTFFNTNQPSATAGGGACGSNLGIAREYLVGFADASATVDVNASGSLTVADRSIMHAGGGYLPSPVPVVVDIQGKKYQAVISGTSLRAPPGLEVDARTRIYWYKEVE